MNSQDTLIALNIMDKSFKRFMTDFDELKRTCQGSSIESTVRLMGCHVEHVLFSVERIQQYADDLRAVFRLLECPPTILPWDGS